MILRYLEAFLGVFHLVAKIIRELKSHMIPYKFKFIGWNYSIQTEEQITTNENTWIYKGSCDF